MAAKLSRIVLTARGRQALGRLILWLDDYSEIDQMRIRSALYQFLTHGDNREMLQLQNIRASKEGRVPSELWDLLDAFGFLTVEESVQAVMKEREMA
jgi:hypothetical protein